MNDSRPIGVFDSGLGGLTAVRALQTLLPNEHIVYFGDTGRVPYGTRSRETVRKYARQDMRFLLSHEVKMVIAACNTVSASVSDDDLSLLHVPFIEVLTPAARRAVSSTKNKKVALIGTPATVKSGAYERAIHALDPDITLTPVACPLFVPLVENGFTADDDPVTTLVAQKYLAPVIESGADTLILGCTHYPILKGVLRRVLGDSVTLIDSGKEAAKQAKDCLMKNGLLAADTQTGETQYYVSDSAESFAMLAEPIIGESVADCATQIDIDTY